ncbi:MAG: hypothetical protein P0S93_04480, partial [Candidatus Neptunochlamydia sp.]|nr:hypothetical protein [Candidatus Neptunochlamydia sp.]
EGFSKRKAFEVLAPYLLISGAIYIFHRQAFKANIMSTAVLGTIQLAISQLSPKIVASLSLMFSKDFDPEEVAFGKADWERFFGEVGDVPSIPEGMAETLKALCPFNPRKQVGDTHMLVLIPKTVNNKPFNLNLLHELIQTSKQEKARANFHLYSEKVKAELGEISPENSYWVLMTKDVIPGSQNKTYDYEKKLVHTKGKGRGSYKLPSAIEAAASILMHYFKTGERLYRENPGTYTRCQETVTEKVTQKQCPVIIGSFSPYGLNVIYSFGSNSTEEGVAAVLDTIKMSIETDFS